MSLWQDLEAMAGAIKHLDRDAIDLEEVRALLRRAQDAVHFADELRGCTEFLIYRVPFGADGDQGKLRVTIDCDDPVQWFADLAEATA